MAPADQVFTAWAAESRGGRTAEEGLRPFLFKLYEKGQLTVDDLVPSGADAASIRSAEPFWAEVVKTVTNEEVVQALVQTANPETIAFYAACTPGYYNNEGHTTTDRDLFSSARYPEGSVAFFNYLKEWVESENFDGLTFT